ncbi:MAG: hypothetical protein WAU33_08060 [Candidatus Binataceae bacterium]
MSVIRVHRVWLPLCDSPPHGGAKAPQLGKLRELRQALLGFGRFAIANANYLDIPPIAQDPTHVPRNDCHLEVVPENR